MVSRLGLAEGLKVCIVLLDEGRDVVGEFGDAAMGASAGPLLGEQGDEELGLIELRGAGGRQVDMPVGSLEEPVADRFGHLCGVAVYH